MLSNRPTEHASLSVRLKVWLESLPIASRSVFVICVTIFVLGALLGYDDLTLVCLSADRVVWQHQVWRFFTAPFFHVGLLHVAFNMMAFLPAAATLERTFGTITFVHLMLLLVVLGDAAYVFISFATAFGPLRLGDWLVQQCAVGLSGVIFGLIVIDNATSADTHRSIFGLFDVPAVAYPWALLVACQLLMPGASFLGHLCGVLVGQLYLWGWLTCLLLPPASVRWMESRGAVAAVYERPCFIAVSGPSASAGGPGPALPSHRSAPSRHRSFLHQMQEMGRIVQTRWASLSGHPSNAAPPSQPAAHSILAAPSAPAFGLTSAGASGKNQPSQVRQAEYGNEGTHVQQPPAPAAPSPMRQQQQQEERSAASSTGRGRQLDPEAGGAMEALAARSAAAAAAEARASGSVAATAARMTSAPAASTTPATFSTPSDSQSSHDDRQRARGGRYSAAAQAAELRAHGIGCGPGAQATVQSAPAQQSELSENRADRQYSSGGSSAEVPMARQRPPLGNKQQTYVAELVEMGFDPDAAAAALAAAHGDIHLAACNLSS